MKFRIEKDSMGEVRVPQDRLYRAQTQRAIDNFAISGLVMPQAFIGAVALIKQVAAEVNASLGLLPADVAAAIQAAATRIRNEGLADHFPVDIFQTGSGTSTNMNVNEVIASLCRLDHDLEVSPNDQVNMGQSSNDVIPAAIHVAASLALSGKLLPALTHLKDIIDAKGQELAGCVKTGRTHLMDAMPVTFAQELSGWAAQVDAGICRLRDSATRLHALAQGGTAVGTGINCHPDFAARFAQVLAAKTGIAFTKSDNFFALISSQDTAVELSGQLKVMAVSLMKMANDLRLMNSGPLSGLGEISLPALQPGSSIMPGKVNPVIPEAVCMAAAQVIGNDATITLAGQSGNFQLNVMLPLVAYNLLQSIDMIAGAANALADKAIAGFRVNSEASLHALSINPVLVTALNPVIGYLKAAEIAKRAAAEKRPVIDVAQEMTDLGRATLEAMLNPARLTEGGIQS